MVDFKTLILIHQPSDTVIMCHPISQAFVKSLLSSIVYQSQQSQYYLGIPTVTNDKLRPGDPFVQKPM